jgi:hypothetical protein
MAGIRQGLLPQVRAACSDEMMPDSLDLPGFSIRIDVRRLYPRNNRQSGVGTLAVVPAQAKPHPCGEEETRQILDEIYRHQGLRRHR